MTTPSSNPDGAIDAFSQRSAVRQRDRIGAWIAWLAVVASVGMIFGLSLYGSIAARRDRLSGTKHHRIAGAAAVDPADAPSIELLITGRTAVGSHNMLGALQALQASNQAIRSSQSSSASTDPNTVANARQVKELAATPLEKLRAAPVLAELRGSAAALGELDEVPAGDDAALLAPDVQSLRVIYTSGPDALSEAARMSLVHRHGWFGKLAVSYGKPASDPARQGALAPARRAALFVMGISGLAVVGFLAGLALAIVALVRFVNGQIRSGYVPGPPFPPARPAIYPSSVATPNADQFVNASLPHAAPSPLPPAAPTLWNAGPEAAPRGAPFIESFAIYLAGMLVIGRLLRFVLKEPNLAWEWLLLVFIPIPILWPRFRGISSAEWKRALGWHTGRGALREIGWGIVGYLAGLPILAAGALLALGLNRLTHAKPTHPIEFEFGQGIGPLLQAFALACVWAPIVEETMFRGALFHHLRRFGKGWRWLPSALLVSFIFAAIHPQGWTLIPALGALAVVFAGLREWRGSILSCMTAHFIQNCVILILMAGMLG